MENISCDDCPDRKKCKRKGDPYGIEKGKGICKRVEEYISQDYVYQRESMVSPIPDEEGKNIPLDNIQFHISNYIPNENFSDFFAEGERVNFPFLSKRENDFLTEAEINKLSMKEIAFKYKTKTRTVESKLYRAKKKIADYFFNSPEGKKRLAELSKGIDQKEADDFGTFADQTFYAKRVRPRKNMDGKSYEGVDAPSSGWRKEIPLEKSFDDLEKLMEDDFEKY